MAGYDRHSETERELISDEELATQSLFKIQSDPDTKDQVTTRVVCKTMEMNLNSYLVKGFYFVKQIKHTSEIDRPWNFMRYDMYMLIQKSGDRIVLIFFLHFANCTIV